MLNKIWPILILISFSYAIFTGRIEELNSSIFQSTNDAVSFSVSLLGTICLWNGIIKIASKTSIIDMLIKKINPIVRLLFPEIIKNEQIQKEISMNIIANILGLGNAATPIGIKAMKSMQKENLKKEELSNSMMTFIVLNSASIQLIPTTVIAIRNSLGSIDPTIIVFPVWIATICAAIARNYNNKNYYKIERVNNMTIMGYISNLSMPLVILLIVLYSMKQKKNVFDDFVEGAKEGLEIVISIFPTLIGLFVSIGAIRSSGVLDIIINFITPILNVLHFPKEIMPLAMIRPISGSGSIAVATDIMKKYGVDSYLGKVASTIMGSTETTLYIIAIYTSCIKIKKTRGILFAALIADTVGIIVSIVACGFFFK